MGEEAPSRNWKKGCLWIAGIAVGAFILTGVIATIGDPDGENLRSDLEAELAESDDTTTNVGASDTRETTRNSAIDALVAERDTLIGGTKDEWENTNGIAAVAALDLTRSEDDDIWARGWVAYSAAHWASYAAIKAHEANEKAIYQFAASLGKGSREHCEALNYAQRLAAEASILYDITIAVWRNEAVEMSPKSAVAVNLATEYRDCSELEPLKLGPGGSSMEPDMTYNFASENANYFTGRCGRQISQFTPIVEQQRCFGTGEKAFRFFKYWVPQADPEWVNASADRRAQLEQVAETYRQNVESTLETLGWMQGGMPYFTTHSSN